MGPCTLQISICFNEQKSLATNFKSNVLAMIRNNTNLVNDKNEISESFKKRTCHLS